MTALRAHQEQIIATQTQHTAILRQIQHHLGILSAPEYTIPILSEPIEPSQAPPFVEQIMPSEESTTGEAEASTPSISSSTAEPSSSHHPPALSDHLHISFMYFLTIVALVIPCF